MYQVVCTRTLDNVDDAQVHVFDYADKKDAIECFNEELSKTLKKAIDNEFLQVKMSMHNYRALIRFESTHCLIAIVEDGGIFDT